MTERIPGPALLLDASTPWMHAGVLEKGHWQALERGEGDALTLLPALVEAVLKKSGCKFSDIRAYIHCEGPGALLGLRLASMMVEAWRAGEGNAKPLYAYRSLAAASAILALDSKDATYLVATPFRKGSYNVFTPGGAENELLDETAFNVLSGTRYLIPQRHIKNAPTGETPLVYDLTRLPEALATNPALLRPAEKADAYAPHYAEYKLWDGRRHKAESPVNA
jgi:tRNA threonylcarbamoyladenosine biosynthesis protein TsaB